jgi:hypothetical protein
MDWKDLADAVGKAAPMLGSLLGGPAGGAVGGLIASALGTAADPAEVSTALANPDALVKLRQIEADRSTKLQELIVQAAGAEIAAHTAQVQAVNATMQAEAHADHWPTYGWRPFIGFVFGLYIVSMFVLPIFGVQPVPLSADLTLTIGAILGVASYFRGKAQADPRIPTDNRG